MTKKIKIAFDSRNDVAVVAGAVCEAAWTEYNARRFYTARALFNSALAMFNQINDAGSVCAMHTALSLTDRVIAERTARAPVAVG